MDAWPYHVGMTHTAPAPAHDAVPYDAPPPPCAGRMAALAYRYPRTYALAAQALVWGGVAMVCTGALALIG